MALVVLCGASFYIYKTNNVSETYENKEIKKVNNNLLSMMLETSAGSGEYQETTSNEWPTEGYVFNENLSKCEKGNNLSWDSTKKTVVMTGNVSDKCYVYFDLIPPVYLADYIKGLYTTQGANNLYLHDSTLENGAGDNSYRYAGSSDTTNNFVCFGYDSTDGTCPTDYLYRIIGVFDSQVKLIKYDYANSNLLGTDGDYSTNTFSKSGLSTYKGELTTINRYYWNHKNTGNVWSASRLNTVNLNTNYLNNIGANWSNKIAMHTWKVGGNTFANIASVTAPNTYTNEITFPAENTTYDAQIGLMYVSDYGYAASSSSWSTALSSYNNANVTANNWMYMGLFEWTMVRGLDKSLFAFFVGNDGFVNCTNAFNEFIAVRPVLYLTSETAYKSGSGTIFSPILLK